MGKAIELSCTFAAIDTKSVIAFHTVNCCFLVAPLRKLGCFFCGFHAIIKMLNRNLGFYLTN